MLHSVASSKRLPEKNLLVLGGTVSSQRDFIEALSNNEMRRNIDRYNSDNPPIANRFALGHTYYDVLDADQDDTLARVSLYLLTTPSHKFTSLVKPLLNKKTIPNSLIVILLDWSQPWNWMRQLREWILFIKAVTRSVSAGSNECKMALEDVMMEWGNRGRTGGSINLDGTGAVGVDSEPSLPPGNGEWEDGLGLPLCVVCQNAELIDYLEKTQHWKEEQFDLVLQFMRTGLLRHGASLIYTSPTMTTPLQSLIHASLGIHSLLKRDSLKANVIDRDKILVLPNWDSWAKIRVLRDGFDTEQVNNGWGIDCDQDFPMRHKTNGINGTSNGDDSEDAHPGSHTNGHSGVQEPAGSVVVLYEAQVQDTSLDALQLAAAEQDSKKLEVEAVDTQAFLETQIPRLKAEQEADERAGNHDVSGPDESMVNQIGPVQFNVGGIQVDADDVVQRLGRQANDDSSESNMNVTDDPEALAVDPRVGTENLAKFFGSLMNKNPRRGPQS